MGADEAFKDNVTLSYTFDYTESVHKEWKNPKPTYRFETETTLTRDRADEKVDDNYGILMTFRGNERIATWEQYVDFSYYDCIFGFGWDVKFDYCCFFLCSV